MKVLRRWHRVPTSADDKSAGQGPEVIHEVRKCGGRWLVLVDLCGVDGCRHARARSRSARQRRRDSFEGALADKCRVTGAVRYQCKPRQLVISAGHLGSRPPAAAERDPTVEAARADGSVRAQRCCICPGTSIAGRPTVRPAFRLLGRISGMAAIQRVAGCIELLPCGCDRCLRGMRSVPRALRLQIHSARQRRLQGPHSCPRLLC